MRSFISSSNIIRTIKSRKKKWASRARMGEMGNAKTFSSENLKRRDLGSGGIIILKTDIPETGCENGDWNQPAQERVQWRAFVNTESHLWVP
jgi:hypothetical protein